MVDWAGHALREQTRYRDGQARLPDAQAGDARERALTRMGNAAAGAALALLMAGETQESKEWFDRAALQYRASFELAPPGSWGRPVAILKSRILAGDWRGAEADAVWTLAGGAAEASSPIARYAATLALLVLEREVEARALADGLHTHEDFPAAVGAALAFIAARDRAGYAEAVERVLESFEGRDGYLEDLPAADTVMVLQELARRRGLAASLSSRLLPG